MSIADEPTPPEPPRASLPFAIPTDSWPQYEPDVGPIEPGPPAPAFEVEWALSGALVATLRRGDYRFGAFIQSVFGDWQAIGLVSRAEAPGQSFDEAVDLVLERHAHQNLGSFPTLDAAQRAGLEFLLTAPVPPTECPCEPLTANLEAPTERSPKVGTNS